MCNGQFLLFQQSSRLDEKHTPSVGQRYGPALSKEQLNPDGLLEPHDGLAQRWLRYMQPVCRPTEVQLFRQNNELLQGAGG
jgi:hypothetical protein